MFLLFQSSFRLSEKNEKDKKRKVLTPVSATPFRGGYSTLNPPLRHSKAREKKSCFMILRGRTMFDPCLGDADTHASHCLSSPSPKGGRKL